MSQNKISQSENDVSLVNSMDRRTFLGGLGSSAILGSHILGSANIRKFTIESNTFGTDMPAGKTLRVKPVLTYEFCEPREKDSYRGFGAINSQQALNEEVKRIEGELKNLKNKAEFPVEILPIKLVNNLEQAQDAASCNCDVLLVYPSAGTRKSGNSSEWLEKLVGSGTPNLMFLRYKSGPLYLWHETVHWKFLRKNGDKFVITDMDVDDIVVDDYDDILWRMRSLYGLKNAKGTKMLAIGSLAAYSSIAQQAGPPHAKDVWNYEFEIVSYDEFSKRLEKARADEKIKNEIEQQTVELLSSPGVKLKTQRKFVYNSFMALKVCKDLMKETGATNFGFDKCMAKQVIEILDTPPCLVFSLANDEGYTAYCHTDLSHTIPGVLLKWIAGKPTFLCNPFYPHHGILTVAHCAAPRKMNGKTCESAEIMTHFESDYGAACKVHYPKGQIVTVIIPNLQMTKWIGLKGKIIDSLSLPDACRSQMEIAIDGDWHKLLKDMEGFHAQVCYGDYLREVGYALKKIKKIEWENISQNAGNNTI